MLGRQSLAKNEQLFWWQVAAALFQVCASAQVLPAPSSTSGAVLSGRILSTQAGCSGVGGEAIATLAVDQLPEGFANSSVTCRFVRWNYLQSVHSKEELADSLTSEGSEKLAELVKDVLEAPSSNATLVPINLLQPASSGNAQYGVTCKIPGSIGEADAVVLANTNAQKSGEGLLLVLPEAKLGRTAIFSMDPVLGPSLGGTAVYVQGIGLKKPAFCNFSNHTSSINSTAVIMNASLAQCTAPPWWVGLAGSKDVTLTVTSGGCASSTTFTYYTEPEVTGVFPLQGPRYGSFQLTVSLGSSLDDLSTVDQEGLWPVIRLMGADGNGSDLILSANLTKDRRSLMAETPIERSPLAGGNHAVHVSLNGQQYAESQFLEAATLIVKGPAVSMSKPYYHYQGNMTVISLGAQLQGMNTLRVTANISATLRRLAGRTTVEEDRDSALRLELSHTQLVWEAGESGQQNFSLRLSGDAGQLMAGGALVSIVGAENADVDGHNATSIVSGLQLQDLTVGFAVVPNQVVYRGENASVPIEITNAAMRLPAAALYEIHDLNGKVPTYIPINFTSGYLQWDLQHGDDLYLDIPIIWANVSYQTEDHLVIKLTDSWNSKVAHQENAVGLHVFGVEADQCPPGTFRFDNVPNTQVLADMPVPQLAPASSTLGWLRYMLVYGGGEWSFDLSSQFKPDVLEYGVIVPTDFSNATLCVQPYDGSSKIVVTDGNQNVLRDEDGVVSTSSLGLTGRKLRGKSVAVLPGPATATGLSGVHALGNKDTDSSSACASHSWMLPLVAGKNDFSISVGLPPTRVPSPPPPPLAKVQKGTKALSQPGKNASAPAPVVLHQGVYALSVVRLADPAHAEIAQLNVTEGDSVYSEPVCGGSLWGSAAEEEADNLEGEIPPCLPYKVMELNVSYDTEYVSLHPGLRYPDIQGLRVEVAGQVLSQGGNIGADQVADTTAVTTVRDNTDFLPVAFVVGLQPGNPVEVPIVVVAEDSVTSLRYYLRIIRAAPAENDTETVLGFGQIANSPGSSQSGLLGSSISLTSIDDSEGPPAPPPPFGMIQDGWPIPPSRQPSCNVCPAGWATTTVDQSYCDMCIPGTYAQAPQSATCSKCPNGTYADSWGSTHCNHCIIGTYAPSQGSKLCFMCPENMTNLEDGSSMCDVPVMPGTNLTMRYAVIVSFGVILNGTSLDEIASKVGVNASSKIILERLIRSDTATAFNITTRDVNVTAITQISRRVLFVNVTATLGVDLPTNSSQDDIQAELAVKNLSADDAIDMLASQPDKFLGRTTKALDVTAEPGANPPTRIESHPSGASHADLLPWYAILVLCLVAISLLGIAFKLWRKRSRRPCWPTRRRFERTCSDSGAGEGADDSHAGGRIAGSGLIARVRQAAASSDKDPIFRGAEYSDAPAQ